MCLIASGFCAAVFQANDDPFLLVDLDAAKSAYSQYDYDGYGGGSYCI